ncbi:MAG: PilZ domain-containing protein [Candidatus Omnitrophica bacterium]|nr:PilZ domain-containing protein [Candidatus Omnitrophota bacterium]MBU2044152.1 PilZ domain-containing protein [Candidatus Omnitrophota bacterium]MBU2250691.1 PilZ domain-containing protein [Candidatus Omnitrophota bacterium]MBU2265471.1 PilZ domain-containing protein [Candidatus Omnitrophota bacterium]
MQERRRFPRVELNEKVMWRKADTFDNLNRIRNISEGGLCFETDDLRLSHDDIVQFSFQLPNKMTVYSKGRVCWISGVEPGRVGWQAGVQFQDIGDPQRQDIQQFVGESRYGCD